MFFSNKAAIIHANSSLDMSVSQASFWTHEQASTGDDKRAVINYIGTASFIAVDDKVLSNQAIDCNESFKTLTKRGVF